eukprot:TRINITY_DN4178_c0_g1_i1.p1 TRINITY_DN4178_c0_g1~~TRINITY_DN4178_c0_g1_i1.p1  ORF type:complete len:193 (+),score=13.97 TRINITY_DN4178_c0_g1_i1:132-710(+)
MTNHLAFAIPQMILENATQIIARYTWLIHLTQELLEMHNYHSMLTILAGLHTASISRIKMLHDPALRSLLKLVDKLGGPKKSYHYLRKCSQCCAEEQIPHIPYISILLSDLTFVEDSDPTDMDDHSIDTYKSERNWQLVASFFSALATARNMYSTIVPIPQLQVLFSMLRSMDEVMAFQRSQELFPRVRRTQ